MVTSWADILTSAPPPNTWAYLDWVTGIIRINCTREQWEILRQKFYRQPSPIAREHLTLDELRLLETLTHETTHYLQICTTGYLYEFVLELYKWFLEFLPDPAAIHSFSELPLAPSYALEQRLSLIASFLDNPEPNGVTVRSIVEGTAYLAQKRAHWEGLTSVDYEQELKLRPPPGEEYWRAYNVAVRYLGGHEAFITYPLLASLSLLTASPPKAFVTLCKKVKEYDVHLIEDNQLDIATFVMLLPTTGVPMISSPLQKPSVADHPIYRPGVQRLKELSKKGVFNLLGYMAAPHQMVNDEPVVKELQRPLLFNDRPGKLEMVMPTTPGDPRPQKEIEEQALILRVMFEMSRRLWVGVKPLIWPESSKG